MPGTGRRRNGLSRARQRAGGGCGRAQATRREGVGVAGAPLTCPVSTGGGSRRVQSVREGGGGGEGETCCGERSRRLHARRRPSPPPEIRSSPLTHSACTRAAREPAGARVAQSLSAPLRARARARALSLSLFSSLSLSLSLSITIPIRFLRSLECSSSAYTTIPLSVCRAVWTLCCSLGRRCRRCRCRTTLRT